MHDVMPIVNDAFRLTTEQLEEVQEYVDLGDLLRLFKRLLRNGRNIDKMLDQLESMIYLAQTVGPLTDSAFEKATDLLQTAEHKGYFGFARGGMQMVDNVVTSLNGEDVWRLGENVVLILNVVKDMTQPEIMNLVHTSSPVSRSSRQAGQYVAAGVFGQMRDPNVRRGLALTMRVLHVVGSQRRRRGRSETGKRGIRETGNTNKTKKERGSLSSTNTIPNTLSNQPAGDTNGNQSYRRQYRPGQR